MSANDKAGAGYKLKAIPEEEKPFQSLNFLASAALEGVTPSRFAGKCLARIDAAQEVGGEQEALRRELVDNFKVDAEGRENE